MAYDWSGKQHRRLRIFKLGIIILVCLMLVVLVAVLS